MKEEFKKVKLLKTKDCCHVVVDEGILYAEHVKGRKIKFNKIIKVSL